MKNMKPNYGSVTNPFATKGDPVIQFEMNEPKGYNYALMADGEYLCESCLTDPTNPIQVATRVLRGFEEVFLYSTDPADMQWTVLCVVGSDDLEEVVYCAHCYAVLT